MNRISDEQLEYYVTTDRGDALSTMARELKAYREAVKEYLRELGRVNSLAKTAAYRQAEATLRALQEQK